MQRKFSSERLGWRGSWGQLFRIIYTGLLAAAGKSCRWAMGTFCWPQGNVTLPLPSSDITVTVRWPANAPLVMDRGSAHLAGPLRPLSLTVRRR